MEQQATANAKGVKFAGANERPDRMGTQSQRPGDFI